MNHVRVGIYIRVSTQEQATEGYSISEQEERLKLYCMAQAWESVKVYRDPGFSGASIDRPGLKALLSDIEADRLDKVLVYKLDRLSRSQKDTLYLIEDVFNRRGVDFVSMTENLDTSSAIGKAMIGLLSVFAQFERETIKERMQMGLDARAKEGYYHGGPYAPIGYDYVDGDLVINEYEALQIRKIWDLAESGLPIYSVYKRIRDLGYTHKYGSYKDSTIRSILSTVVYSGRIQWKDKIYQGRHEAIIDPERFDRMQNYLATRDIGPYKRVPFVRKYLLTGLLICGNCGARYYVKTNVVKRHKTTPADAQAQRYYTCYSRGKSAKNMIVDPNCKNKTWNVNKLDKIILDEVRKLALDPEYLADTFEHEKKTSCKDDTEVLEKRIKDIDKQIGKLVDLYQVDGIDFKMINTRIQALNEERSAIETEIANIEKTDPDAITIEDTREILATFSEVVDTADDDTLREILESLIDAIIVDGEDLRILWKFS